MASLRRIGASAIVWQSATLVLVYVLNVGLIPAAGFGFEDYTNAAKTYQFFAVDYAFYSHLTGWLQLIFAGTLVSTGLAAATHFHRTDSPGAAHIRAYAIVAAALWAASGALFTMTAYSAHES